MSEEFKLLHRGDFTIFPKQTWLKPRDALRDITLIKSAAYSSIVMNRLLDEEKHLGVNIPQYFSIYDFESDLVGTPEWRILETLCGAEHPVHKLGHFMDAFLILEACLFQPDTVRIEKEAPYRPWQLPNETPADIVKATQQDIAVYFQENLLVGSCYFFEEQHGVAFVRRYLSICLPGDEIFLAKRRRFIVRRF